jgi:hypothetical protein
MKSAIIYIVSVGGCVLAIIGLLYLGDGLEAPRSVGGTWAIEASGGCDAAPIAKAEPALKISQSGPRLEIDLGDDARTVLHGDLEGAHVTAESRHREGDPARVRMAGDVEKGAGSERDRLRGTLEVAGCEAPIAIVATRQPPPASAKKGH